ncbi:MAG TPA: JAB domain-containing protein, partial [Gammaproteobacteria bacterium]|nr:JAB domain-containing protein [Gammaproteobacteria bacterium]
AIPKKDLKQAASRVRAGKLHTATTRVQDESDVAHLTAPLRKEAQENLVAVVTDDSGEVQSVIRHTIGQTSSADVEPAILAGAIHDVPGGSEVWLVHNHPAGDPSQSVQDERLNAAVQQNMEGTGVRYRGSVVVAPGGEYTFNSTREEFGNDGQIPNMIPGGRRGKAATVESRKLRKVPSKEGRNPIESARAARDYMASQAGDQEGILLLDTRHNPAGFLPMTARVMAKLRTGKGQGASSLLQAMHQTNATSMIARVLDPQNQEAAQNLSRFADNFKASLLDVFTGPRDDLTSMAVQGNLPQLSGPYLANQAPGFYYQMEREIARNLPDQGENGQMLQTIQSWAKKGRFKQEELDWSGLQEWLQERADMAKTGAFGVTSRVSKEDILDFLRRSHVTVEENLREEGGVGPNDTVYDEYTMPGGENYRELTLVLPHDPGDATFQPPHFRGEQNILAHVRFNDRVDADGNPMLFIEEVQSDWHQAGRERGYQGMEPTDEEVRRFFELEEGADPADYREDMMEHPDYRRNTPPNAPFKANGWTNLAMKRMIRWASEHGYSSIGWTTGSTQTARYNLAKHFHRVELVEQTDASRFSRPIFRAYGKSGIPVFQQALGSPEQVKDYVGEEVGTQLLEKKPAQEDVEANGKSWTVLRSEVSGLDLETGGEGMKKYYDEILPNLVKKYTKKWGAKPERQSIDGEDGEGVEVWQLPVTEQMRDSAMAGQPLFQDWPARTPAQNREGLSVEEAQDAVRPVSEGWRGGPGFEVVWDVADLPFRLAHPIQTRGFEASTQGVFDPATGKVYLIAKNLPDAQRAQEVLLHETVGHFGIRSVLGAQLDEYMDQVATDFPAQVSAAAKSHGLDTRQLVQKRRAAEEALAEMVEGGAEPTILDRIVGALKRGIRAMGFNLHLSDRDLRDLVGRSYRYLRGPMGPHIADNWERLTSAFQRDSKGLWANLRSQNPHEAQEAEAVAEDALRSGIRPDRAFKSQHRARALKRRLERARLRGDRDEVAVLEAEQRHTQRQFRAYGPLRGRFQRLSLEAQATVSTALDQASGDPLLATGDSGDPRDNEALASGLSKIGRPKHNWLRRILSRTDGLSHELRQGGLDKFYGLLYAERIKEEREGVQLTPESSSYIAARMSTTPDAQMRMILKHGPLQWLKDKVGNPIMAQVVKGRKGLLEILDPISNHLDLFEAYLAGRRAARLWMEGRERLFTPEEIEA